MMVCIGKNQKRPVYDEKTDSIVPAEMTTVVFTFDHRYGDAAVAGHAVRVCQDCIEDPENFDPNKHVDKVTAAEREQKSLMGMQTEVNNKKKN